MLEQGRPHARSLRLFVAIELPEAMRQALRDTIDALKHAGADEGLRWVRPEGIHLTLKFLGSTMEEHVPAINTALRVAVREAAPFELRPEGTGAFGGRRNLRVVWVGLAGETGAVVALAERVDAALERLRFPREQRALNPHLSLARVREDASPEQRVRIHDIVSAFGTPVFPAFRVSSVSLMESTLQRGGAVYRQVSVYPSEGAG